MEDPRVVAAKFSLTNEQSTLFVVLHGRSQRIARIYLGAIIAIKDGSDPERLAKAAHEMRELMLKMSEIADVETRALNESMGQKVADLETEFYSMVGNSKLKGPNWDGPVDLPVRRWLNKSTEFFDWKTEHFPRRRDEVKQILRGLEGPNRLLPAEMEKINIELWMETKSFFDKLAHHGPEAAEREFLERMTYVEGVLQNKLNPKTFADFDAVDALIEEGEKK